MASRAYPRRHWQQKRCPSKHWTKFSKGCSAKQQPHSIDWPCSSYSDSSKAHAILWSISWWRGSKQIQNEQKSAYHYQSQCGYWMAGTQNQNKWTQNWAQLKFYCFSSIDEMDKTQLLAKKWCWILSLSSNSFPSKNKQIYIYMNHSQRIFMRWGWHSNWDWKRGLEVKAMVQTTKYLHSLVIFGTSQPRFQSMAVIIGQDWAIINQAHSNSLEGQELLRDRVKCRFPSQRAYTSSQPRTTEFSGYAGQWYINSPWLLQHKSLKKHVLYSMPAHKKI